MWERPPSLKKTLTPFCLRKTKRLKERGASKAPPLKRRIERDFSTKTNRKMLGGGATPAFLFSLPSNHILFPDKMTPR